MIWHHDLQKVIDNNIDDLLRYAATSVPRVLSARGRAASLWALALLGITALLSPFAFLAVAVLRMGAAVYARRPLPEPPPLDDWQLPKLTVLVPLFKEAAIIPTLVRNLQALDYPHDRLEVIILLEACDTATQRAARHCVPRFSYFRVVVVPEGGPRTKPRACDVGLALAQGDVVVVFDGEDRPEPDQPRKAAAMLATHPRIAVAQARLGCDHAGPGAPLITRLWALEYLVLFGAVLPFLARCGLPFLLGGTSNYFRTAALRKAGGWDAHNVTEDADLGVRLARLGYRSAVVDSTTWEEAPLTFATWTKQRGRWLKGFIITTFVHARSPLRTARELGPLATLALLTQLPFALLSIAAHPLCLAIVIWGMATGQLWAPSQAPLNDAALALQITTLLLGYAATFALNLSALWPRPHGLQRRLALMLPLYWLALAWALLVAVVELRRPHHWAKTAHGLARRPA